MNSKRKQNIILGLMIFLFVIFISIMIAWALGYISINKVNTETSKTEENMKDTTVKSDSKEAKTIEKEVASNTTSASSKTTFENVSRLEIDKKSALNADSNVQFERMFEGFYGINLQYENSKLSIFVESGEVSQSFSDLNVELGKNYEITNIDMSKVANVYMYTIGIGMNYPYIFFLMKDGTVEYLNTYDALVKNNFNVKGKLTNVSNVVDIVRAGGIVKDQHGGGYTVVAIRNDGNFYDLATVDIQW